VHQRRCSSFPVLNGSTAGRCSKQSSPTGAANSAPHLTHIGQTARGKKNWKSADLILAALYCLTIRESEQGNDCFILANDEAQAGDDLEIAKKLVIANPDLSDELEILQKEIRRRDGHGSMMILPARDVAGAHGKTFLFIGFDEIHSYKAHNLFEALAPDPTRVDALTWVTSYDTIYSVPGVPLYDFKLIGKAGTDPRMLFSWYSGDYCTDPTFAELEPVGADDKSVMRWFILAVALLLDPAAVVLLIAATVRRPGMFL
jgi:hypothetical protein